MSRDEGLRQMLADLAQDVTVVDLSDRVAATSRSHRVRRQMLTYAGAFLAVVAVGVGTIIATANTEPPMLPVTVPPSASGPPLLSAASLHYLGDTGVHILDADGPREVPYRGTVGQCGLAVSPDGTRLAWSSPGGGDLIVANAVYPLPGGNWLVRRDSDPVLTIVSPQAEVVGSVTEPFELSQIAWLRVVPN